MVSGSNIDFGPTSNVADAGSHVYDFFGQSEVTYNGLTRTGATISSQYNVHIIRIDGTFADQYYRLGQLDKTVAITPFTNFPTVVTYTFTY